jgi:hypothetical protein
MILSELEDGAQSSDASDFDDKLYDRKGVGSVPNLPLSGKSSGKGKKGEQSLQQETNRAKVADAGDGKKRGKGKANEGKAREGKGKGKQRTPRHDEGTPKASAAAADIQKEPQRNHGEATTRGGNKTEGSSRTLEMARIVQRESSIEAEDDLDDERFKGLPLTLLPLARTEATQEASQLAGTDLPLHWDMNCDDEAAIPAVELPRTGGSTSLSKHKVRLSVSRASTAESFPEDTDTGIPVTTTGQSQKHEPESTQHPIMKGSALKWLDFGRDVKDQ